MSHISVDIVLKQNLDNPVSSRVSARPRRVASLRFIPYKDGILSGQKLNDPIYAWVSLGTIESRADDAMKKRVNNPK